MNRENSKYLLENIAFVWFGLPIGIILTSFFYATLHLFSNSEQIQYLLPLSFLVIYCAGIIYLRFHYEEYLSSPNPTTGEPLQKPEEQIDKLQSEWRHKLEKQIDKLQGEWQYKLEPYHENQTVHSGPCTISFSNNSLAIVGRRKQTTAIKKIDNTEKKKEIDVNLRWSSTLTEIDQYGNLSVSYVIYSDDSNSPIPGRCIVHFDKEHFNTMSGDVMRDKNPYGTIILERLV